MGADAVGDGQGGREIRVADEHASVRQQGLSPIAAGLAGLQELDADDVGAMLSHDLLEPFNSLNPTLALGSFEDHSCVVAPPDRL